MARCIVNCIFRDLLHYGSSWRKSFAKPNVARHCTKYCVGHREHNLKNEPWQKRHIHTSTSFSDNDDLPVLIPSSKYQTRSDEKIHKISKAMRAYLQRAQEQDAFIKQQTEEYEMGKRHLANMMGVDPDQMTQKDIDEAISYLMPSGLFEPHARPFMKHPDEVFPKRKAAEFDISGRPFHFLFYTVYPNYYEILHDIATKFEELDAFQDKMIREGILHPPSEMRLILSGSEWIKVEELNKMILEEVKEHNYKYFVVSMTRLAEHPYAYRVKDFIMKYRKTLTIGLSEISIPPLFMSETGQPTSEAKGYRKKAIAYVTIRGNGTGKVTINGQDITYFKTYQEREQLLFPLQLTGLLHKVDLEATVSESGPSAQAGAIRYGISLALLNFVDKETMEKMRLAGLLTRDPRVRERKKPGQKGARAKYTWLKR